jgi:hypothetical protein
MALVAKPPSKDGATIATANGNMNIPMPEKNTLYAMEMPSINNARKKNTSTSIARITRGMTSDFVCFKHAIPPRNEHVK